MVFGKHSLRQLIKHQTKRATGRLAQRGQINHAPAGRALAENICDLSSVAIEFNTHQDLDQKPQVLTVRSLCFIGQSSQGHDGPLQILCSPHILFQQNKFGLLIHLQIALTREAGSLCPRFRQAAAGGCEQCTIGAVNRGASHVGHRGIETDSDGIKSGFCKTICDAFLHF